MATPRSSIRSGLKQSKSAVQPQAVKTDTETSTPESAEISTPKKKAGTSGKVLVGASFDVSVRDALKKVGAQGENLRKSQRDLLGEAINDLCAKYKVPQPYTMEN